MNGTQQTCPKCSGEMVQGTVVSPFRSSILPISKWIKGLPKLSFWMGVHLPRGQSSIPIGTYRCQSCGFLEAYARAEFKIK